MVGRHHLVQIKDIEELALLVFLPSHHAPLPMMIHSIERNRGSPIASMGVLQHNPPMNGHSSTARGRVIEMPPPPCPSAPHCPDVTLPPPVSGCHRRPHSHTQWEAASPIGRKNPCPKCFHAAQQPCCLAARSRPR